MHDPRHYNHNREIVTMYAPIFREKLKKLEACGQQGNPEAAELRVALMRVDHALACAGRTSAGTYEVIIGAPKDRAA